MKYLPIIFLLSLVACGGQKTTTTTIVAANSPSPIPTTTITTPLPGNCAAPEDVLAGISPDQIRATEHIMINIRSSVLRVVGAPGLDRTDCGAATGIVLQRKNDEVLLAVSGALVANATDFWVENQPATVLGKSINPPLAMLSVHCNACRQATAIRITTIKPSMPSIAGMTNGSAKIIGHPASVPDGPYRFAGIGPVETWVFTLVPQAAASGDGIWEKDGRLIGIAYAEEHDLKNASVHRLLYIPASDLILIAKSATDIK